MAPDSSSRLGLEISLNPRGIRIPPNGLGRRTWERRRKQREHIWYPGERMTFDETVRTLYRHVADADIGLSS